MDKLYSHQQAETDAQKLWELHKIYTIPTQSKNLYSIDTPPPTVSGMLHIGHIFSYTQTDIIARYKRMKGFQVFYPFGFDDNGLPTERYVEKKRDVSAHVLGRSAFIKLCLEETVDVEQQFKELWQRMGLSVDWNLCYSTISDTVRKISQESFIRLYNKKNIYRAHEPALYCTTCRTSVAQAELEDAEKPSTFNDIIFKLGDGTQLVVGTTRPELLFSCVALLYHPSDPRYQHLKGKHAITPIFEHPVPIIADELVSPEKGTGLVMCCTFGDKTDIVWFKKHKFPYKPSIGLDGRWLPETGILAGLKVHQARERILEELKKQQLLLSQKPIIHTVNIHERCKKEIEYLALLQWFLKILEHKKTFLDLADQINWYPTFMKSRYKNWAENINWDWCLSRQRFFGIPFPAWHCLDGKHIILAQIKDLPIDPQEIPFKGSCPECGSSNIVPDTDVMDTWNTSSLTPYICYNLFNPTGDSVFDAAALQQFIPMSMRPQAHDIIRTWAFYTIVKAWMHHDTIPWKNIVISGHVLSDAKEKISKSKENNPLVPENLLKQYPADVIRYWTASGSLGQDVSFSENQLKIGQRLITKLWNAFRFIHEHITEKPQEVAELGTINEWLLHQYSACFTQYQQYFDQHEFSLALDQVEKFFWHDFCDNYLELIKDQLFKPEKYSAQEIAATKQVLYTVGLRILQLYAPYLPHITETLYQLLYKRHENIISIHQTTFDAKTYIFEKSAETMRIINNIIAQIRKLKTAHQLSLKTELETVIIYAEQENIFDVLRHHEQLIKGVAQAKTIKYQKKSIIESYLEKNQEIIAHIASDTTT